MEDHKKDTVINYYLNKFSLNPINLNPKEREFLEKVSQQYEVQDIMEAINLIEKRPKNVKKLEKELIENLNKLSQIKYENINKKEKISEINELPKIQKSNTKFNLPKTWDSIFEKENIPKGIVDLKIYQILDDYLKNVYLSNVIADYLFKKLPEEKLKEYKEIAKKHVYTLNLNGEEKKEALEIYIKYLIKKDYKIYI